MQKPKKKNTETGEDDQAPEGHTPEVIQNSERDYFKRDGLHSAWSELASKRRFGRPLR